MRQVIVRVYTTTLILICLEGMTLAQIQQIPGTSNPYPGGGPGSGRGGQYPGGQYPGGQYPGGQGGGGTIGPPSGIPGIPGRSRSKKSEQALITTTGILRAVASEQFVLEADDHRIITFNTNPKTTVTKDSKPAQLTEFSVADHLSVAASQDDKGFFTTASVTFQMAGSAEERSTANRTWDLPSLKGVAALATAASKTAATKGDSAKKDAGADEPDAPREIATTIRPADAPLEADDPGRPQLRRGKPAPRGTSTASIEAESAAANSVTVGAAAEAIALPGTDEDDVIAKAREAAQGYAASLPNFLVKQLTTRYSSDNPKRGWDAQDTTSADVTYENGTQTYANVKVGNRAVKSMEESGGSWSTGEFATWMEGLLGPSARARFRRTNTDTIQKRSAIAYKFEVPRERSNWRVAVDAQIYYPAFRGTVWFDSATSRVLRIEAEARGIPPLFPDDKVETAIDYDFVRLAATQSFLLPTAAEVLACQMGTTYCSRNRIEFRNYRKFGSESGVSFDDVGADKPKQ